MKCVIASLLIHTNVIITKFVFIEFCNTLVGFEGFSSLAYKQTGTQSNRRIIADSSNFNARPAWLVFVLISIIKEELKKFWCRKFDIGSTITDLLLSFEFEINHKYSIITIHNISINS